MPAAAALGGVYLAVAYLSISRWDVETALLWPASGLYIGALLASDRRLWPSLAFGALIGGLGANILAGNSGAVSLAFAVPSCAEGLLGAVLVLRLSEDRFTLERVRDVAALVGGAAIVANGLTALSAAAAAVQAYDASFGESWLRWWSADALGIVAVAPLVVLALRGRPRLPSREQLGLQTLSFVLLAAVVVFFSMADPPEAAAIVAGAVGFPGLLWAGWRWSIRAAAPIAAALALAVTYIASRDVEALGLGSISSADTIVVQAFLATLLIGSLAVACAAGECRRAERKLGQTRDRLDRLVAAAPVAYVSLGDGDRITKWNGRAGTTFGWERSEALGRRLHETIVPQSQSQAWRNRLERGAAHDGAPQALVARHRGGHEVTVELTTAPAARGEGLQLFMTDVTERERARAELVEAKGMLERRQEELHEVVQRVEQLAAELRHKALQLERADQEQTQLRAEFEQAEAQRDEALRRLEEARQASAQAREAAAEAELATAEAHAATAEARQATAAREAELESREAEVQTLRRQLATAASARDAMAAELEQAGQARKTLEAQLERLEDELVSAQSHSEGLRAELEQLHGEQERTRAKLEEAENAAAAVRTELEETRERFAAERERLERALAEGEERLSAVDRERRLLGRRATELIARYDARGICLYASPACRELLDMDPQELVGRQGADLLHPDDRPLLSRARATEGDSVFRARLRRKDGNLTEVKATFSPIRDQASGRLLEIEATLRRAPAERQIELQEPASVSLALPELSDRDPQTGLLSRTRFEEELRGQLAAAGRYGNAGAVLAVDLDRFRELDGVLGRDCTDDLVRSVAHAFRQRLRATDLLGRTGDDQFAVVLPRASASQAHEVANVLLQAVREVGRVQLGGGLLPLTASIGIACFGSDGTTRGEELLVEAEIAVQDAKQSGGDRAAAYDGSGERQLPSGERFGWAEQIRGALENERFVLHAQRIVSLADDQLVRHELLPRMIAVGGELVPPAAFLAAAARVGLAGEVDRWLLRRAVAVLAREGRAGGDPRLEVALSAAAPVDAELADFVAEELADAGADPRGLCLTVPETAALRGGGAAGLALRRLNDLGCEVGLDGFGTGLASFLHVEGMAVSYLKLDASLVRRMISSRGARLVVDSIAGIAWSLGRRTVARSVPDRETLSMLRRLRVGYAQGPAVSEPRPLAELQLSHSPEVLSS